MTQRSSENIKIFIKNHIIPGTNITHDGWGEYMCLDDDDSVWTHETHNNGVGTHSTSHIETYWSFFNENLNKLYQIFPPKSYIFLVWEGEFRTTISGKSKQIIIKLLFKLFKIVYDYCDYDFSYE